MECKKKSIAIIGAGPAGCMCAYFASKDNDITQDVMIFDFAKPLHTLLYTGGGRCNLAYAEYDFKELAKFYPRGEKFLYSVFSKFSTADTIDFFKTIGVETYVQDDLRIFPTSNSASDVREKFLNSLKNCTFKKEKVLQIKQVQDDANTKCNFLVKTENNAYHFDKVVIATGGHAGFKLAQDLGHTIVAPKPALTGLITAENFKMIQGVSLKNVKAEVFYNGKKFQSTIQDDMIFTHEGISGPLAYKISSIYARENYNKQNPLKIKLDFLHNNINIVGQECPTYSDDNNLKSRSGILARQQKNNYFQNLLNANPKKDVKNLIAEFVPKSLAEYIVEQCNLTNVRANGIASVDAHCQRRQFLPRNDAMKCHEVNGKMRDLILKQLQEFEINVVSPAKDGEVVTSGGVCLDEINPKTMQSKLVKGLYFCGEVIDVDGFCGGFNLQNCWSTGFVVGSSN